MYMYIIYQHAYAVNVVSEDVHCKFVNLNTNGMCGDVISNNLCCSLCSPSW